MEDLTDVDCRHVKRVKKNFKVKNLGEYHDFYVQSDTLLLVDVFENIETNVLKYMNLILLDPTVPAYSRDVWDYKNANTEGIQQSSTIHFSFQLEESI